MDPVRLWMWIAPCKLKSLVPYSGTHGRLGALHWNYIKYWVWMPLYAFFFLESWHPLLKRVLDPNIDLKENYCCKIGNIYVILSSLLFYYMIFFIISNLLFQSCMVILISPLIIYTASYTCPSHTKGKDNQRFGCKIIILLRLRNF